MENQNPDGEAGSDTSSITSSVNSPSLPESAMNFHKLVMETFKHQPDRCREYLRFMRDFKRNRISSDRLIFGVHLLFKEHKELLKEFNDKFIPENYKGDLNSSDFRPEHALALGIKVQRRLEPKAWSSFVQILYRCFTRTYDRVDAFVEISKLFEGHPDLIFEYWTHIYVLSII